MALLVSLHLPPTAAKWPLPENAQPYQRYEIHQGEVLFVRLSTDERYLYTMGDDNTLFMFDVEIIVEGRPVSRKSFNYSVFDDVLHILQPRRPLTKFFAINE